MLVVVDQLRADLLDRYGDLFTGGFRRLRTQGHSFVNAAHDHAVTVTAAAHATLATGVYPSRHGVISNLWLEKSGDGWVPVENIDDTTVKIVGVAGARGASPVHLMRSGFAEWLVSASPRSKVASVSGKDRGAIQPAAHARGAYVYWFEGALGRFVTSTYYRKSDPQWVTDFNATQVQRHSGESSWDFSGSPATKSRSDGDTLDYEADGVHTFFPHTYADEKGAASFWVWWENTPFVDALTLEIAEQMVTSLELGRDDAPDFLNVSVSATDRVGHRFGPLSREQLDNLLRLDRELGAFLTFLDEAVGADLDGRALPTMSEAIRELPYGALLLADVVTTIAVGVATALLVLPGLALLTVVGIVGPVINIERRGVRDGIRRSVALVARRFWTSAALLVPLVLLEHAVEGWFVFAVDGVPLLASIALGTALGLTIGATLGLVEVVLAHGLIRADRAASRAT